MGHRTTQRILICDDCGRTPEDGEFMWAMGSYYICETCIDKDMEDSEKVMLAAENTKDDGV
jgi:hypothetical protein